MIPEKTLRDEFAMAALQGLLASPQFKTSAPHITVGYECYKFADAMLKVRREEEGK